jgi:hypothetical protein
MILKLNGDCNYFCFVFIQGCRHLFFQGDEGLYKYLTYLNTKTEAYPPISMDLHPWNYLYIYIYIYDLLYLHSFQCISKNNFYSFFNIILINSFNIYKYFMFLTSWEFILKKSIKQTFIWKWQWELGNIFLL